MNDDQIPEEGKAIGGAMRRLLFGANTIIALMLAAGLLLMVNYLSARHYHRTDWSRTRPYELSPKTRQLLGGVSNRVNAILFFRPGHALFDDVEALLREYEEACPKLHVEHVDPDREQARAGEIVKQFGLTRPNVVIFTCADQNAVVGDGDMIALDTRGSSAGVPPRRAGFLGEQAFSTAILQITQPSEPVVYFLLGHGERDPLDLDKYAGYSEIAHTLAEDHIEARPLMLSQTNAIPADADAIVIAGPERKLAADEVDTLRKYLARSGRIFLALDSHSDGGLAPLLAEWGVRIGDGLVVDTGRSLSGSELFISDFSAHPITSPMTNVTVVMYLPRPLEPIAASGADKPSVTPLLFSSRSSWAEADVNEGHMSFDPGRERRGPLPVAVAIEKGQVAGVDIDIRPTRLVVVGDTDFASNGSLVGANPDLFLNSLNWLLARQNLLSIAAKPVQTIRLVIDHRQLSILFWIVTAAIPGLVALAGLLVWSRRRS